MGKEYGSLFVPFLNLFPSLSLQLSLWALAKEAREDGVCSQTLQGNLWSRRDYVEHTGQMKPIMELLHGRLLGGQRGDKAG